MTKLRDVGTETQQITTEKVDWLKHRIQPFFMLKMPDKFVDETIITEPLLFDYKDLTIGEM